jgi:CubicO group peptidase (beta-lactamase class C family)
MANSAITSFSPDRLTRIAPALRRYIDDGKIAGISAAIADRDTVVWQEHLGLSDIASGRPIADDAVYRIYSMTKPVTSVAILMLLEEGALRLADPVSRYAPAFASVSVSTDGSGSPDSLVAPNRPITIRDLLTHTSGLSYGLERDIAIDDLYRERVWAVADADPAMSVEAFVNIVAALPLAFQPGATFRYSVATDVLGYIIQVASGMPFDTFLQRRVLDPLGMTATGFQVRADDGDRLATVYGPDRAGGLRAILPPGAFRVTAPTAHPLGGSGLVSTIGDYTRFSRMLLRKGELDGVRLLGRKTVEWMTTNHLPPGVHPMGDLARGFGLGVSCVLDPGRSPTPASVGNFGWGGLANTHFWVDPVEEFTAVLMLQYMPRNTHPVIADFQALAYAALEG